MSDLKKDLDSIRPRSDTAVFYSWGIPELDEQLGEMFCPMIVDITGQQDSGKTTLMYQMIAQVQKEGGIACYIHTDGNIDYQRMIDKGVDTERLLISNCPGGVETVWGVAKECVDQKFDIVCIDSISALVPDAEFNSGETNKSLSKNVDRLIYRLGRRVLGEVSFQKKTIFVMSHQLHHESGSSLYGGKEMAPYSRLAREYSTLKLLLKPTRLLYDETRNKVGIRVSLKSPKNLVTGKNIDTHIKMYFDEGFYA